MMIALLLFCISRMSGDTRDRRQRMGNRLPVAPHFTFIGLPRSVLLIAIRR